MTNCNHKLSKEVSIPYPLYQSNQGNYFIGQTPILTGQDQHALASLTNPVTSKVNIYVNAITVTNISAINVSAEVYLRSTLEKGIISHLVSCANVSIVPEPIPRGQIEYLNATSNPPTNGVSIFSRIVSPYTTLVIDGGQIIIPPGQSLIIYLGGYLPVVFDSAIVAFGWWEEKIYPCNDCCC
ncbi:MAG: DUF6143 family protein [Cellulosilyticaceae bacterium]